MSTVKRARCRSRLSSSRIATSRGRRRPRLGGTAGWSAARPESAAPGGPTSGARGGRHGRSGPAWTSRTPGRGARRRWPGSRVRPRDRPRHLAPMRRDVERPPRARTLARVVRLPCTYCWSVASAPACLLVGPRQADVEPGRVVEKGIVWQHYLGLQRRDRVRSLALRSASAARHPAPRRSRLKVTLDPSRRVTGFFLHPHDLGVRTMAMRSASFLPAPRSRLTTAAGDDPFQAR